MEVEEHGYGLLGDAGQRLEGAHGIALPLVERAAVRVHPATRDAPGDEGPPDGPQGPQITKEAILLVGEDCQRRVARAQVVAQPLRERTQHGDLLVSDGDSGERGDAQRRTTAPGAAGTPGHSWFRG
jgi:hypothetical protein